MNLTRLTRNTSAAVVAGVAAIASYSHMRDLAALNGQSELLANLMPVSVDGMLIVSTTVMVSDRVDGRTPRASAKVSFVIGVAASIVANVLAAPDTVLARTISAWPAVALLLVVEMLARAGKVRGADNSAPAEVAGFPPPERDRSPRRAPGRQSAADRVARAVAKTPDATPAQIAARLKVSERTVTRHWPAPAVDTVSSANGHRPGAEVPL